MERIRLLVYTLLALVVVNAALDAVAAWRAAIPLSVPLGSPTAYRNIYLHIPMAWTSLALFTIAFIAAILYLWRGDEKYDRMVKGFAAVGLIYAAATLVTGSAWAAESWEGIHIGFSWSWDPRETSVLLLFLAYLAYFVIRGSISDPDRAATLSNTYAIAAYAMVPLVFIAPGMAPASLHPSFRTAGQFMRDPHVLPVFVSKVLVVLAIGVILGLLASSKGLPRDIVRTTRIVITGFAVYTILAALLLASPYYTGSLAYIAKVGVANVTLEKSGQCPPGMVLATGTISNLTIVALSGRQENVTFSEPVAAPLRLCVKPGTNASELRSVFERALTNHIVVVDKLREGSVVIVTHWSVALSLALDGVIVAAGYLVAERMAEGNRRSSET